MPYQNLQNGLYLVKQRSAGKSVNHYGILDVGNRLNRSYINSMHPIVIHQTPPTLRTDWLRDTGNWSVLGQITDESMAIQRIGFAAQNPAYDLFGNNCEHFARFVATGTRESKQIQTFVGILGSSCTGIASA